MKNQDLLRSGTSFFLVLILSFSFPPMLYATGEGSYSGSYIVPEAQTGFEAEEYEAKVGEKFLRGVENFFLSPLEIPHGVKREISKRRQEYLPTGVETVFIGLFRGFMRGLGRAGVGLYEAVTFPYPQEPILEEMDQWLY